MAAADEMRFLNVASLLDGITADTIRSARDRIGQIFHPDIGNKEGLSWKNLAQLLPYADSPVLKGVDDGGGPYVTVIGHDFKTFAAQGERMMGIPKPVSMAYSNLYWHRYNQGLAKITESERSKGPLQAPAAGHFVQADNPGFVAGEVDEVLTKIMP
jgi:hypothetical protein